MKTKLKASMFKNWVVIATLAREVFWWRQKVERDIRTLWVDSYPRITPAPLGITPGTFKLHVSGRPRWDYACNFGAPDVSGQTPRNHPCNFSFPVLISRHLGGAHGSFLSLLAAPPIVGLHPTGPQGRCLPNFKTKERAPSQWQRHQWFNGWGKLTRLKHGPGGTPHCVADGRQDAAAVFTRGGKGRFLVTGGIDVRLARQLPGKLTE